MNGANQGLALAKIEYTMAVKLTLPFFEPPVDALADQIEVGHGGLGVQGESGAGGGRPESGSRIA